MEALLNQLKGLYPQLKFTVGKSFVWSPETGEIFYKDFTVDSRRQTVDKKSKWALLHETGHALLGHKTYQADFELIRLEVAAWEKAKVLASEFGIAIEEEHIQDCLDTYRDWLHKRSICPECSTKSIQQNDYVHYRCHNCHTTWRVTPSRFCRAYRRSKDVTQPAAAFHFENNL